MSVAQTKHVTIANATLGIGYVELVTQYTLHMKFQVKVEVIEFNICFFDLT